MKEKIIEIIKLKHKIPCYICQKKINEVCFIKHGYGVYLACCEDCIKESKEADGIKWERTTQ